MKKYISCIVLAISVLSLIAGIMTLTSVDYKQNQQSMKDLDSSLSDLYSKKQELSSRNYGIYSGLMGLMMDSTYASTSDTVSGLKSELQFQIDAWNKQAYTMFGISVLSGIISIALFVQARKE